MPYKKKAQEFLDISHDFKLGSLPTEKSNPRTTGLSEWARNDLFKSLKIIKEIDKDLLNITQSKLSEIEKLQVSIQETLKSSGRIFLCGCGATGRLSLALETIWRLSTSEENKNSVISFMSGGDVALIHSIENFEDFPEYGERQLLELGFGENDLLISTTEGGETPFVIGATLAAKSKSNRKPYFLYCNPDNELIKVAKRSEEIINDHEIEKINLNVGEMVLAGSTRMQASTILMLVVGMGLLNKREAWLSDLISTFDEIDFSSLEKIILKESEIYESNDSVIYRASKDLAISVLTDTTERSPTFSLNSFESSSTENYSLCYLSVLDTETVAEAWSCLLGREPRPLEWEDTFQLTGISRLKGFDISDKVFDKREMYIKGKDHLFDVSLKSKSLEFELDDCKCSWNFEKLDLLGIHIILKILLNTHSTLVMGRLGRYESNIMTWVRPSNNKLIDRTIRYISILLKRDQIEMDYRDICIELFKQIECASRDEALVLKVYKSIKANL
jgi:N-acetylmuramic acid 6-phosphate etherase